MSDTMHSAAELLWESQNADAERAQVGPAIGRMEQRAGVLSAVIGIAAEIDRHANAIDPRDPTAVSVLVDLQSDVAQAIRMLAQLLMPEVRS